MPKLTQIRIGALEELAEQLRYAPAPTIGRQIRNIQTLAGEIDPEGNYPEDWIVFRVTGYRAEIDAPALLPGAALLAELSALAEHLSSAARLPLAEFGEGFLALDDLTRRWSVSRRTIERYRRRGLVALRTIDERGAARLLFSLDAIRSFENREPALLERAANLSRIDEHEREHLLERARALRAAHALTMHAAAVRLAAESGRSVEAIRLLLRARESDVFETRAPLTTRQRRALLDAWDQGEAIADIARIFDRSRASTWRIVNEMRLERLRALHLAPLVQGIEFDNDVIGRALAHPACTRNLRDGAVLDALDWVEAARADPPMNAETERARSTAIHALCAGALAIIDSLPRDAPPARALDEAETDLRWAALIRMQLARSARGVALRAIEDRLGASILDLNAEDIRRAHGAAMLAALQACDRFAPQARASQGGRFAARASIAIERAIAGIAPVIAPRAAARRAPGAHVPLDDWTIDAAPWMRFLDLPAESRPHVDALPEPLRSAIRARHALNDAPPGTLASIRAEHAVGAHALQRKARAPPALTRCASAHRRGYLYHHMPLMQTANPNRSLIQRNVESVPRTLLAVAIIVPTILDHGWRQPLVDPEFLLVLQAALMAWYAFSLFYTALRGLPSDEARHEFLRITRPEQACAVLGVLLSWWGAALALCAVLLLIVHIVRTYLRLVRSAAPPGLVFLGSFIGLILIGTAALELPAATPEHNQITFIDALFTITSAISQTGLVVRPTGDGFTRFGQVILLIWIQVGALGVIVFGALLATLLGSSFGLRATKTIAEGTEQGWAGQLSLQRLVTFTIMFTFAAELLGVALFYVGWPDTFQGMPRDFQSRADRLYHSIFFSVSSFCNAGFVTTGNSVQGLRAHWIPHLLIAPMIVLGSIGFPVLDNLRRVAIARIRGRHTEGGILVRINLNSKVILSATVLVYALGYVLIVIGELSQTDAPLGIILLDAHFMSINRTSGFDSVAPADMGLLSRLTLILLMFIGGSPASIAGGIKLMVFAVLVLTVWATIRGRSETSVFGRTLPDALVRKSATLIVLCLFACMLTTAVLAMTETTTDGAPVRLGPLLFEAVSAFCTCGYSLGITPELSPAGKFTITIAMFVGRVGIFAFLAALFSITARKRARVEYATESVVVY